MRTCSRYKSWLGHHSLQKLFICAASGVEVGRCWKEGDGHRAAAGAHPRSGGACLPPLCPPDSLTGESGGTWGCHQGAINASAATAASGWCWVLSRVLWSTWHPAPTRSRQRFVAEETGPGGLSETIQLLGARREHRALPSAGLAATCDFPSALPGPGVGISSLRSSQRILTLPHDRIFLLGILLKTD